MENNHIVNRTFDLQLTTLSPVAINSGKELSPLSDYFVMDGFVHFVDGEKFQKLLLEDSLLFQTFEERVENTSMEDADNFLNDLLIEKNKLKSIAASNTIPYFGENTILLKEISKIAGAPYIAGSSIKGAIKNAILYYWLTKKRGSYDLKDFFSKSKMDYYKKLIAEIDQKLSEISIILKEAEDIKKQGGRSSKKQIDDNRKKISKLRKDINKTKRRVIDELNLLTIKWEFKAFGIKKNVIKQPSSNLKISDTNAIPLKDNVEVSSLKRKSFRNNIDDWILNNQEYIKPNAVLDFQLQIATSDLDWKEFEYHSFLKEILQKTKESPKPLFDVLNHFSLATANSQKGFQLEIPNEITNPNPNEAYLSLGSGKGIYRNTVLLAIRKHYEQNDFDFLGDFAPLIANIKETSEDFPNSVSHINNKAMGWIKLTYNQEKK